MRTLRRDHAGRERRWHVAVVVENVPAGVDTRLRKQLDDLVAAGFQVSVVTRRSPDNDRYRTDPQVRLLEYPDPPEPRGVLGFAAEYAWSFGWAAAHLAAVRVRGTVDVLQLCQPPDVYFPLGWLLRATGTRVVVDQRDLMPELLAARYGGRPPAALDAVLRWLERRSQRVAHHTVTVNDRLVERLVEAGADPARVSVVRNGPVLARADRARPDPALRGGHRHLVCWAGKMGPQDRVELVLDVADRMVNVLGRRDCGFVVLGDGECVEDLRRESARRGLEPWVRFPGWLPEDQLFSWLRTADVGLDTSLQEEVSPVKVMEYMGCRLPVACFDLPETRRITEGAGVLVAPGDVEGLTDALAALLDDEVRRAALARAGHERVRDWLAWEQQSAGYLRSVGPPAPYREAQGPTGQPSRGEHGGVKARNSAESQVRAASSARTRSR